MCHYFAWSQVTGLANANLFLLVSCTDFAIFYQNCDLALDLWRRPTFHTSPGISRVVSERARPLERSKKSKKVTQDEKLAGRRAKKLHGQLFQ